jgi:uncharacterized protein YcaQ
MSTEPIATSLAAVRRLAVAKQRLAGPRPPPSTPKAILSVVRDLGYVQWDPVNIVAPSHLLSLACRLDGFRAAQLERLLWTDKRLFLHWTPMASIVSTADRPLFLSLMHRYPESLTSSWGNHRTRARKYLAEHARLRATVLAELADGPRTIGQFTEHARTRRPDAEWTFGSDVAQMLFHLLMRGEVMVVGHAGTQNLWGRTEQFLPDWGTTPELSAAEAEREAAQRAIRALGTATPREITFYFVRGRYDHLPSTLAALLEESTIHRVVVEGLTGREERYVHRHDVALLERLQSDPGEGRVALLPPFDNLVCSPARTKRLFGFEYVREQFLPKAKRRFGTYVLPILAGDRLIGRVDPRFDRARGVLVVHAVHAEPGAPADRSVARAIGAAIERLARFVGAKSVAYTSHVPPPWKNALR